MKKKKENSVALLLHWAGEQKFWLFLAILLSMCSGLCIIVPYIGIYRLMDATFNNACTKELVVQTVAMISAAVTLRFVLFGCSGVTAHKGAYGALFKVRCMVAEHMARAPLGALNERRTGDIKTVLNEDIEKLELFLAHNLPDLVCYMVGPVVIQTFRAYGVGGMKNKTVINAMREFCRISFVYEAKVLPIGAGFGILSWLSCPLVILLAYAPWVAGTLNTVDYLLICMLPLFCAKLANSIFVDLTSYKNLMISKNKILSVMNESEETGSMEPLHTATHEITFDNVDFAYVPGEPVLKHATFTVPDQKLTAIVGDSGSGKSTILNLIAKYYEATGGTISIGGKPINHVVAERVLEQVSMVDQDIFLFDDTIRDNIRHARPSATDTEIEAACREANCDSFIRKMEKGYDMPTGENGNLLSGGERQRISIARAILKNSPILLLDEATASLDIENELAVKQAIANLLKEKKTVVMIAHTLSIVKNADQILVMGDGRIAESGTHEELLAKGGKYAAMWNAEQKISA